MGGSRMWMVLGAIVVAGALAGVGAPRADAQGGAVALDASKSVRDNLKSIQAAKKGVEVVLKGGKSYRGQVGAVGDDAVVLTQLEGREFFDALIDLDEVAALEVRAR